MIREAIRQRLTELDITQRELGKFVDIREQHLSNFLCGLRTIPFKVLVNIFSALGLTLGETEKSTGEYGPDNIRRAILVKMEKRAIQRKELSEISGVNPSVISSFLRKQRPISLSSLEKLARALDLQVAYYGTPNIISK